MSDKQQRYRVKVLENGRTRDDHAISDPFINTWVRPRGLRAALGVLMGRYEVEVQVHADPERVEQVLELDPDYVGAYGSERRKAWNAQLNAALGAFADSSACEAYD
jgi:hypothetical protein